jgi:hypothetical protein
MLWRCDDVIGGFPIIGGFPTRLIGWLESHRLGIPHKEISQAEIPRSEILKSIHPHCGASINTCRPFVKFPLTFDFNQNWNV